MVDLETARDLCLSLPEVNEYDHFGRPSYRVKKKIFATLHLDKKRAVLKFSKERQSDYCEKCPIAIFPVNGKWGEFGWTYIELSKINKVLFQEALWSSWRNVAPKTLIKKID